MSRTVSVHCAAIPFLGGVPALTFVRLQGEEKLNQLFTYTLQLKTPDADNPLTGFAANIDLKTFIGQECTVEIALDGKGGMSAGTREIGGLVTGARIVRSEGRHVLYELTLRPWFWLATRTTDFKIFQAKNVMAILDDVLGDYPFSVDKRLNGEYPAREYQVQYGESDFHFLQRLMEEWGIYWYFEHAEHKHRLVLCDHPGAHTPFPCPAYATLAFYPGSSRIEEEHLHTFERGERLTSGVWATNDFDFTKPLADLTSLRRQPRKTAYADGEIYVWPGDYAQPAEGEAFAGIRMEELLTAGSYAHGAGHLRAVVPGCTFTLENHPHDEANQAYLILSAAFELEDVGEETGLQSWKEQVTFEARPASLPYRPVRTLGKPHTCGPQTAIVTGPSGQEIWTDKYGRVKIQFHWDRYGKRDENTSCWVRVSQPWAGASFGAVHLPRIGQEVIVDFLNGDPDLPMITGRVYNATNMPPWSLPDNATQSGILTRSSKDASEKNANALRFEDKKGEEEVWLHAEKDQRIEVENDESIDVGHDERIHIGNNRSQTVDKNEDITIGVSRIKKVGLHESDLIGVNWNVVVGALKAEVVGGACTQEVGLFKQCAVGGNASLAVGANMSTSVSKNTSLSVGGGYAVHVGGSQESTAGKDSTLAAKEIFTIRAEKDVVVVASEQMVIEAGSVLEIKCGKSTIRMDKDGKVTINGSEFTFEADGPVQLTGSSIDLN